MYHYIAVIFWLGLVGFAILAVIKRRNSFKKLKPSEMAVISGDGQSSALKLVARCVKNEGGVKAKMIYAGPRSCLGASLFEDGPEACSYACLGFGDCVKSCPWGALIISDNTVKVSRELCRSCGQCVINCPRDILSLIPGPAPVIGPCVAEGLMKEVSGVCRAGCLNCGRCLKNCLFQAISRRLGKLCIDYDVCSRNMAECRARCLEVCPRKLLRPNSQEHPSG